MADTAKKTFSDVILTLDNVLLSPEKLSPTPSELDKIDKEIEMDLRILGCELIQTSGILLKLPQVAMATGQVLFQRFFYAKSFARHDMETVAMGCINLASKIEESPRRVRDVINVFHRIKQVSQGKVFKALLLDENYKTLKNQVIKSERRVLKELGFCCHVKHPHKIIILFLKLLGYDNNKRFVQLSWNYMNDIFRTDVFVRYAPETIAVACVYLAARHLKIPLPNNPHWFLMFKVKEEEVKMICMMLLRLYARKKPDRVVLDKEVNIVKEAIAAAKNELKQKERVRQFVSLHGASQQGTPNSSRPVSPKNVSPAVDKFSNGYQDSRNRDNNRSRNNHKRSNNRHRGSSRSRSRSRSVSDRRSPRYYRDDVRRSRSRDRISAYTSKSSKDRRPRQSRKKQYRSRSPRSYSRSPSRSRSRERRRKYNKRSRSRSLERDRAHRSRHGRDRDRKR